MMNNMMFTKERNIDIVFCIDATSSMGPCIENVRKNATMFYRNFADTMTREFNSDITSLRVQVVTFRDLECDVNAIQKSEFFELPSDTDLFERYLAGITPRGGGDYKESGLEAIYTAMTTKWEARGGNDRSLIVLFTDADAIDFGEKARRTGYENIVDESTFMTTWACALGNYNTMSRRARRLVVFAPPGSVYDTKIRTSCEGMQFCPVLPKNGMADIAFDSVLKIICASASR